MRTLAISVILMSSALAAAQNPPGGTSGGENREKKLDAVLEKWEAAMAKIDTLQADIVRTTEDKTFGEKVTYRGQAKWMSSRGLGQLPRASLYLKNDANPAVYEQLVLSGLFLYEVSPASKEIRVHAIPQPPPGQNVNQNMLGLMFGMAAKEAKNRYEIALSADQNYHYLHIKPKLPRDKADFSEARLALRLDAMPRELVFKQVNNSTVRWDLPAIQSPANLKAADFDPPPLPAGWKMNRIPAATPQSNKIPGSGN